MKSPTVSDSKSFSLSTFSRKRTVKKQTCLYYLIEKLKGIKYSYSLPDNDPDVYATVINFSLDILKMRASGRDQVPFLHEKSITLFFENMTKG